MENDERWTNKVYRTLTENHRIRYVEPFSGDFHTSGLFFDLIIALIKTRQR